MDFKHTGNETARHCQAVNSFSEWVEVMGLGLKGLINYVTQVATCIYGQPFDVYSIRKLSAI